MIPLPPAAYDEEARRIIGPGGSAHTTRSEHAVLMRLVRQPRRLVTRDVLIGALWHPDSEPDTSDNTVRVVVCRLRKKLAAVGAGGLIHNVWGDGYVLAEPPKRNQVDTK